MGKSKGERRVIFSSSGAIRTICSLLRWFFFRRPPAKVPSYGGSKETTCSGRTDADGIDDEGLGLPDNAIADKTDGDRSKELDNNDIIHRRKFSNSQLPFLFFF